MNFDQSPEFKKDIKRLKKKWRSLPDDVEAVQRDLVALYVEQKDVDISKLREAFFSGKRAAIIQSDQNHEVVKMRLDVESLGTNSKIRIIFVAVYDGDKILFIEMYAKNDKDREDADRIKKYTNSLIS